ncbi:carbohydrate binding domain-containing protein [Paenibacillus elgii]
MLKRIVSILLCFIFMIANASSITVANGETKYLYNHKGQLVEATNLYGTIYYDYDLNGGLIRKNLTDNMLTNASFEVNRETSGIADGWYGNKDQGISGEYEVVAHHASSGQYAQKITGSGLGLHNQINVFQDVKIDPGKTYTASSRIFVESLTNARINLTVDYLDAQYRFIGAHFETSQNATTVGGFLTLSVTGQAPANAAYARVWLVLMGTDKNGAGTSHSAPLFIYSKDFYFYAKFLL